MQISRGNVLVIASTTAVVIALTWGGVEFSWSSPKVLVPLIIGCLGLIIFMVYEARVADTPLVSLSSSLIVF